MTRRRCGRCRADAARYGTALLRADLAAVAALFAVAGIAWLALAPLRIWHVTGADGGMHPDGATWAAYGISGGLILAVLMFLSIRAVSRAQAGAARGASITEALDIADSLDGGFPRRPLRDTARTDQGTW